MLWEWDGDKEHGGMATDIDLPFKRMSKDEVTCRWVGLEAEKLCRKLINEFELEHHRA